MTYSHLIFKDNQMENCRDVTVFFSAPNSVTTGYLARAVVNNVLQGGQLAPSSDGEEEDHCRVS